MKIDSRDLSEGEVLCSTTGLFYFNQNSVNLIMECVLHTSAKQRKFGAKFVAHS